MLQEKQVRKNQDVLDSILIDPDFDSGEIEYSEFLRWQDQVSNPSFTREF